MIEIDVAGYVGLLMGAWGIGFSLGYVMTKFLDAMKQL